METFLIPRSNEPDTIINVPESSHKGSITSCKILMKLDFFDRFSKHTQISNFMKICPAGAKLFHVDG